MKLVITKQDGTEQVFDANVLLYDAWSLKDGQLFIRIDAQHNERDANGRLVLGNQADFDLNGTREEMEVFIKNIMSCVRDATKVPEKKDMTRTTKPRASGKSRKRKK